MANSSFITLLKRKIKSEIVNDELIVKVFGSPNYDSKDLDFSAEDVGNNYIFTWNQNPETITEVITFVTLQVNIQRRDYRNINDNFVKPTLIINIFSHNNHLKLNPKEFQGIAANRNDYLSQLLDNKFNGRISLGNEDDVEK